MNGDSIEYEYTRMVDSRPTKGQNKGKSPMTVIAVNDIKIRMTVDTGGSVNVMDERLYERIQKPTSQKQKTKTLTLWRRQTTEHPWCVCDVTIESKSAIQCHHFHVVQGAHRSLIGFNKTQELGLEIL